MIAVRGVHHVGLTVRDVQASIGCYAAAGYRLQERIALRGPDGAIGNGLPAADLDVAFLGAPRLLLELVQFTPPAATVLTDGDPSFGHMPVWSTNAPAADPDGRPLVALAEAAPPELSVASAAPERTTRLLATLGFRSSGSDMMCGHGMHVRIHPVTRPTTPVAQNAIGRVHICCQVDDLTLASGELVHAGFEMISTPRIHENLQWMFVRHPEGPGVELLSIS